MSTLRIDDLTHSNELNSSEMATVSGGFDIGKAVSNVIGIIVHGIETVVVSTSETTCTTKGKVVVCL